MIDLNKLDKGTSNFYVALYRLEDFYVIYYVYRLGDEWFISDPVDYELGCVDEFSDFIEDNLHLFDIDKFNASVKNFFNEYYDENGIRIIDEMNVYVKRNETRASGIVVNVFKKNDDYYADFGNFGNANISVSFEDINSKSKKYVTSIPAYYIKQSYWKE